MPSNDWLSLMAEIHSIRHRLYYSRRRTFDAALRPAASDGESVIDYPDAIYGAAA